MKPEPATRILIVDDDALVADALAGFLRSCGWEVVTVRSAEAALQAMQDSREGEAEPGDPHNPFAVLIADMRLPGMSGLDLLRRLRDERVGIVCIAITGYGTIEDAVKAVRLGAIDYLTKPLVDEELRIAVEKAINQHKLVAENHHLREQLDQRYGPGNIVGNDRRMQKIFDVIDAVAPSKTTVLMCGESGTGKSLIARALHRLSPRADQPFVELSCGSIPETLLESELFGHVKGAFTGAHVDKKGRFVAAHGGTIFLDEINSASPAMQLKLLRVLQERKLEPVGADAPVEVDVRIVLASNQPLEDLVARGEFRQDLYYRINVVSIDLPPLRDRLRDIALLAEHFLAEKARDANKQVTGIDGEAMRLLQAYAWPGNVRELENVLERAVVLTRLTRLGVDDLPAHVANPATGGRGAMVAFGRAPASAGSMRLEDYRPMPLRDALLEPEKQIILAALQANEWNRQKTAQQLDINRTTLYKKIKQYDLEQYGEAG